MCETSILLIPIAQQRTQHHGRRGPPHAPVDTLVLNVVAGVRGESHTDGIPHSKCYVGLKRYRCSILDEADSFNSHEARCGSFSYDASDKINNFLRGCAGQKDFGDTGFLEIRNINCGDGAAEHNDNIIHTVFLKQLHQRARVLCAPERMESPITSTSSCTAADAIMAGVWRKPVNDFHTRITKYAGNNLSTTIVSIEPSFGNQNPNFLGSHDQRQAGAAATTEAPAL
jgi:hypothetical protein